MTLLYDFEECYTCRDKKVGADLCDSCIHNRGVISELRDKLKLLETSIKALGAAADFCFTKRI